MHCVYILKSMKDGMQYVGSTDYHPDKRLTEYNRGINIHARKHKPYGLIWYAAFNDKDKVLLFEKYLKHGSGHAFKKKHLV